MIHPVKRQGVPNRYIAEPTLIVHGPRESIKRTDQCLGPTNSQSCVRLSMASFERVDVNRTNNRSCPCDTKSIRVPTLRLSSFRDRITPHCRRYTIVTPLFFLAPLLMSSMPASSSSSSPFLLFFFSLSSSSSLLSSRFVLVLSPGTYSSALDGRIEDSAPLLSS
jgi:hypothetical protein